MDSTYAPQSPDLSSFFSSPPKSQQAYNSQSTSYAPRSPTIPSFNTNPAPPAPTSTYNQNAYPQNPQIHQSHQSHHHNAFFAAAPSSQNNSGGGGSGLGITDDFHPYPSSTYQVPDLPPQHSFQQLHQPTNSSIPTFYTPETHFKSEDSAYTSADAADSSYISSPSNMGSRQPRNAFKSEKHLGSFDAPPTYKDPNPNNIEIKTKFPVARIKRIMQADEEVGKVAQVTPVAVSKALELFMIALVTGAAEKAKEKGGKRVTAQHLKAVVLGAPEQFDFLAEIVGRVAEAPEGQGGEGKGRRGKKEESETSDEDAQQAGKKKGKGKGGRRKKMES